MTHTLGLYIGRFQPFHNGHKSIVDTMIQDNEQNLILIGVSGQNQTEKNPFTYTKRFLFITETYKNTPGLYTSPLVDNPSDERWIQQMLGIGLIQKSDHIRLYCGSIGEDTAIRVIQQYERLFIGKKLEIIEIDRNIVPISGTQVRHEMKEESVESVENLIPKKVYTELKKTR